MLYEYESPGPTGFEQIQYSQFGEDMVIWHALESRGQLKNGIYVDVGAHHPTKMSNTCLLHRHVNWRGINIEPDPTLFVAFEEMRPRDINLNIGCADKNGEMELTIFNHPAANTMHRETAEKLASLSYMEVVDRRTVPVRVLRDVLDEHLQPGDHIGLLSVDAEGLDYDIITTADIERRRPTVLCLE